MVPWEGAHRYKPSPGGTVGRGRSTDTKLVQVPRGAVSGPYADEASGEQARAERARSAGVPNVRKGGAGSRRQARSLE